MKLPVLVLPLYSALSGLQAAPQKPNIILVMLDDTGYGDYKCLGNPIMRTPVVDAFKRESLLFQIRWGKAIAPHHPTP